MPSFAVRVALVWSHVYTRITSRSRLEATAFHAPAQASHLQGLCHVSQWQHNHSTPKTDTMRSFFAPPDHTSVSRYVLACLNFMKMRTENAMIGTSDQTCRLAKACTTLLLALLSLLVEPDVDPVSHAEAKVPARLIFIFAFEYVCIYMQVQASCCKQCLAKHLHACGTQETLFWR